MSTVIEIESAIEKLSPQELGELAAWYEERQALLNASDSLFQAYDGEEQGKRAGRSAAKFGWSILAWSRRRGPC